MRKRLYKVLMLGGTWLLMLLAACAHPPAHRNPLAEWVPSPNHEPRRPILIVLHATEQTSVRRSLDTLRTRNRGGPVSAHYLIGRDGSRYQLVADEQRAWHAGAGRWGTITDVNSVSIGIELDNDGAAQFPPAQIDSLLVLLTDLCDRLRIPRTQIVAHSDFAPTRKRDPNVLFPWQRLAEAGFGIWPAADAPPAPPGFDPWQALQLIGYPLDDRPATVRAFHRRFRGTETDTLDGEDLRILHALTQDGRQK
ncbi:N-acetylmuramoyl-L-alanine amidase [Pseudoxanthomonas wuyuanensis]